jgi:hypothetical protein
VLIAQPLFRQMNITGAPKVAAKFIAAWKSPSLAAPSPKYATTQHCRPWSCKHVLHALDESVAEPCWLLLIYAQHNNVNPDILR